MDNENDKEELSFKVIFVGDVGTGKTCFIKRYVENLFSIHYKATIGSDFSLKVLEWDENRKIRLQLWDIAGQERFSMMTRIFYRDAVGAFVVFDVTRASTLEAVNKWKDDLDSKTTLGNGYPIPIVLLANKSDQESLFSKEQIEKCCHDKGFIGWFETSAKENFGLKQAVHFLVEKIIERQERGDLVTPIDRDVVTPVANRNLVSPELPQKQSNPCC